MAGHLTALKERNMKRNALPLGMMAGLAALSVAIAPTAAEARWHDGGYRAHGGHGQVGGYYGRGAYARGGYDDGGYGRGYYGRRPRCRGGAGGTIIGAIAGGLLGNAVAGYGNRGAGTIIGGGFGALAGNAIARGC
jgi:hypothetical protein